MNGDNCCTTWYRRSETEPSSYRKVAIPLYVSFSMMLVRKNGKEAYDEIKSISPDVKVLFMSGYPEDVINQKNILEEDLSFVSKPINPIEFLKKIRGLLDS